jgi:nucleoside-diphosphate-sugar epimerase
MKTVLILGAMGSAGQAAMLAFLDHGWRVLALVRERRAAALPEGVTAVTADLFDAAAVAKATGPVDVVFNGLNAPYHQWRKLGLPLHTAAADLAEALQARMIFPGNVYNFGRTMPAELWPETKPQASTVKGRNRVAIEAMLAERATAGRLKVTILRAGDFIGGANSWMSMLVAKNLNKGQMTAPGRSDIVHAWAYLPDFAETAVRLAEVEERLNDFEVFHFENHNLSMQQIAEADNAKLKTFPRILFYVAGLFGPSLRATLEMLYLWDVPHALKDRRLQSVIGHVPKTPLSQIIATLK